jgi:hypothetical protein
MIELWKQDFNQLKSMKISAKTYRIDADGKEKHLFTQGSFVYDVPLFLDDVTLVGIKENANSKMAYDGKYFYAYTSGKALAHLRPADHPESALIRATEISSSKANITINPLYYVFEFALTDDDKSFGALSKPATWENLKKRIVDFKSNSDGSYLIHCQRRIQSGQVWAEYEVTVVLRDGVYVPISIKKTQPQQKVVNIVKVLEYSAVEKSTFPLPIPLKISAQTSINDSPFSEFETIVDKENLQINSPIDKGVFTLHPKTPAELIDVETLE